MFRDSYENSCTAIWKNFGICSRKLNVEKYNLDNHSHNNSFKLIIIYKFLLQLVSLNIRTW